jgi:hypothetical protein
VTLSTELLQELNGFAPASSEAVTKGCMAAGIDPDLFEPEIEFLAKRGKYTIGCLSLYGHLPLYFNDKVWITH